jgi:DNA-binding NarL/FixJ family response regulator
MAISVSIVEDVRDTREGLRELLDGADGLSCLSTYPTAEAALTGVPEEKPDVVLVDINLPGMNGIECVAKLKIRLPQLRFLMMTTYEERDLIFNSLRAGAHGYLLKKSTHTELIQAIEQVHAGGAPMSMQIARKVVEHFHQISAPESDMEKLTEREKEILGLLAQGYLYKEISDKLGISFHTVKTHIHVIYEKLHVQSRTQATAKFFGK